jgi:hypothetical protein
MDIGDEIPNVVISVQDQKRFNPLRLKTRKARRALVRELNSMGKLTPKQTAKMNAWGKIGSIIIASIEAENLDRSDPAVILMMMEAKRFLDQSRLMREHIPAESVPVPSPPRPSPLGCRVKRGVS